MITVEVRENNLYQNGRVVQFPNGEYELEREIIIFQGGEDDQYYTVQEGDEVTKLAYQHYKNYVENPGEYYWLITDANNIENPLDLSEWIGVEIIIPSILKYKATKSVS